MKNDQSNQEYLDDLRHSAAHLLAKAILELFPGSHNAIGPSIENGFYQDFDMGDVKISEADLPKIENKMREILPDWKHFDKGEVTIEEARKLFKHNPYKIEMIEDLAKDGKSLLTNDPGNFLDLCKMGHVANPSQELKHFKLLSIAGAYWRGDEKNQMLTRIYGTAWSSQAELDEHLQQQELAKERDHRKLGQELELFFIDEMVGKGLVMWLPKGQIIKEEIEKLVREKESAAGYVQVATPHIAREELYLKSGHLPYYKDSMYPPMAMDDGDYYLKAMNCPHHHRIYQHKPRSYRDLPLRIAEYGMCYRNELSGTLAGLLRVRGLEMNDAHLYCRKDQIKDEFKGVMKLTQDYFDIFGLKNYWFRLSKWSPEHTEKYIDEPENWQYSQQVIREVLDEMKVPYEEADDEAAFYGPKVDVQFKSVLGREETMSTIQLDFLAKGRFELSYIDELGQENNEVFVIHRAPLSVHERFMAFLIEHYGGKFPVWLSPVQVKILPISDEKHADYAREVAAKLKAAGVRAEVDERSERLSAKIRDAQLQKVPYMLIVGDQEKEAGTVSVRDRDGKEEKGVAADEFAAKVKREIDERDATT